MNLIHVNIEPTNICQLNCEYCSDKKKRVKGYMNLNDYKRILSMLPHPVEIRLFCSGEPFLHPNLDKMIELALEEKHVVLIHSNGLVMTRELADRILGIAINHPKRMKISFSMHTQTITDGLDYLIKENGGDLFITLQTIVPYPEKRVIPDYLKKYQGKVDYYVRWPHNWDRKNSVKGSAPEKFPRPCGFLEDSLAIYWNGDVPICCADLNGERLIGNLFKLGWDTIIEVIDKHRRWQESGLPCQLCKGCERYTPD